MLMGTDAHKRQGHKKEHRWTDKAQTNNSLLAGNVTLYTPKTFIAYYAGSKDKLTSVVPVRYAISLADKEIDGMLMHLSLKPEIL